MCTGVRFTSKTGGMYFGRNLDWGEQFGQQVYVTPKGYQAKYLYQPAEETKHAIIGMGIVLDNYPLYFDCGNDAGLACGGLNFPGFAQYESGPVEGKTNIAAYEFLVWLCSNFETVDQVEAALKNVAIVGVSPGGGFGVSLLHWLIADKNRSITVEYMPDGMHIFENDVDVLTNQPTFDWHMQNLRNYMNCEPKFVANVTWDKRSITPFGGGANMRGIPGDYYSPSRFVKVAYLNANYPVEDGEKDNVIRMFHTLKNVSMAKGASIMENGQAEFTLYTGGFSSETQNYYYDTYDNPAIHYAKLSQYAGAAPDKVIAAQLYTD